MTVSRSASVHGRLTFGASLRLRIFLTPLSDHPCTGNARRTRAIVSANFILPHLLAEMYRLSQPAITRGQNWSPIPPPRGQF